MHTSSRHPIFIHELLTLILSHLDDKTVARTATVCRQWADIALDAAWRDVTDIRRLLELFCPLSVQTHYPNHSASISTYKLSRALRRDDWQRFEHYAYRVRSLSCDDTSRKFADNGIWNEILRLRTRDELLPNLQSLSWHSYSAERQACLVHFLHPGVRQLSLNVFPVQDGVVPYISQIHARGSGVTHLEIRSEFPMTAVQAEALDLLSGIPRLMQLTVPIYGLTSVIMSRISTFRHLSSVAFSKPVEGRTGQPSDVAHFSPSLSEGAFPALQNLSISAHLVHSLDFITSSSVPRCLTSLYVNILAIDNSLVLQHFFSAVATHLRQLKELRVDFIIGPNTPIVYPPPPLYTRPNIETFRPLLACPLLTRFEFRWDYQVNLTQADIEEIASNWTHLESFVLACQPIPEVSSPTLTMHALLPFAQHCPRIQELGLYLNGDMVPHPYRSSHDPRVRFKHLHSLCVGGSPITHVDSAALFLSQLLPLGCEIVAGVRWPDAFGLALDGVGIMDDRRVKMTEWWLKWKEVARLLPLAIEARLEERERIAVLEREIERLRLERA